MSTPIVAKAKIFPVIIITLIGIGAMGLSIYFIAESIQSGETLLTPFLWVIGFLILLSVLMIYVLHSMNHYEIKNNQLTVSHFWGHKRKIFPLEDIQYYIIIKIGKYKKEEKLIIFTEYQRHSIYSTNIDNYDLIKIFITAGKNRNTYLEKLKIYNENRYLRNILIVLGIMLPLLTVYVFYNSDKTISHQELSVIQLTTKEISHSTKGKLSNSIHIYSEEYPNLLIISGSAYWETYKKDLLENISKGDFIIVSVLTDDYLKKLSKKSPLSLWEKITLRPTVDIIELQDTNRRYLSLEDINKTKNENSSTSLWAILGGVILLILYIFKVHKNNKKPNPQEFNRKRKNKLSV